MIFLSFSFSVPSVLTSFMSTRFRGFSIVLPKTVVHEFVEDFFKGRLCFLSEVCVDADVWFHPGLLIEFKHPVHLREFHTLAHVQLEVSVVNYILFFIHEVWHKLGAA